MLSKHLKFYLIIIFVSLLIILFAYFMYKKNIDQEGLVENSPNGDDGVVVENSIIESHAKASDEIVYTIDAVRDLFRQGIEKKMCDEKFLVCIDLDIHNCVSAVNFSVHSCSLEKYHKAISSNNISNSREDKLSEIKNASDEFGSCVSKAFQENTGKNLDDYPGCVIP